MKKRKATRATNAPVRRGRNSNNSYGVSGVNRDNVIQRYVDLYDFAPIPYVSFDRGGRISEANLSAVQFFGKARNVLIGCPFAVYVARDDTHAFLDHLLRCRASDGRIETELRLIGADKDLREVSLTSAPIVASMRDGAVLFQTAIVDLTERKRVAERLAEQARLLDLTNDGIMVRDENDRISYWNDGAEKMYGYREKEALGRNPHDLLKTKFSIPLEEINRVMEKEGHWIGELVHTCKDGKKITVMSRWALDRDAVDGRESVLQTNTDITKQRRAAEELMRTEERFRLLVGGAKEYAMFLMSPKNRITFWSRGAERVFGWSAKEAVGQKGDMIFTPEDRQRGEVEKEITTAIRDGQAPDRRWHMRKDGTRVWIDGVMQRLDGEIPGEIRGFAKVARDATDQRRADEELRRAHDDLERRVRLRTAELQSMNESLEGEMQRRHELEREILEITERERARIGQDLHDMLCQELTATALFLKSSANQEPNESHKTTLNEAAQIVNRNVSLARDLARGLQPAMAGSGGLVELLRRLCREANEHPRVHCTLKLPKNVRIRDENLGLNIFRVAQEAVRNAVAHSDCTEIVICVERERDLVRLVIEDNGKGFRPSTGKQKSKGLGLHIMKYRANALGGTLMIDRRPKGGTKVTCEIPVQVKARPRRARTKK